NLDMTRGKPSAEQLELSMELQKYPLPSGFVLEDGTDLRNYGGLDGFKEAKMLFSKYLEVEYDEIIIGGNSSLNMMYDSMVRAMLFGVPPVNKPWGKGNEVRFICPCPGYDRHFTICESLGIKMIPVGMKEDGPDMDAVESLAGQDASIKGIWCVPKYSNPTGTVYSDSVIERLSAMKCAADDFRIFYDNAYTVHYLEPLGFISQKNLLRASQKAGNPNRPIIFGSTSKITFPGAGVAMLAASRANSGNIKKHLSAQTIGPDKINIQRHIQFFSDIDGIHRHMERHAAVLRPKFDAVDEVLERELSGKKIASWTRPKGGYFVSLDTLEGCARETVRLAAEAGVKLTNAGATYPYSKDPRDRNIRIAPSMPTLQEIWTAMEVVAICVQIASINSILRKSC
ncbi:MAG: aminotransferase class I/II-fold pyridoxal phosphate-dependent enzyme, partial [Oligoflexales bacterium]|nr:aminotransferase class I/II-fold pyridoxal phosphate-dependent enzyme [Oligoflexales bacterium]